MSHFAVAVITEDFVTEKDLEEILLPYSERLEVEPRIDMTKKEMIKEQESFMDDAKNKKGSYANKEFLKGNFKLDMDHKDFVKWYYGDDVLLDSEGNQLTTYNPDSKWDWFVIGGRWRGLLLWKVGDKNIKVDQSFIKCVNWDKLNKPLKQDKDYWNRFWEVAVEKSPQTELEIKKNQFFILYKKSYYLEHYKNKEMFIRCHTEFGTHAVVTPDGKWHEKGKMGWFGCSSEIPKKAEKWDLKFYERFIKPYLDTDCAITIVDCHI